MPQPPTLPASPLHLGAMASDQTTPSKSWGHLGILFIGVSQVLVPSPCAEGPGLWGGVAVPEVTAEPVSSGIKKEFLGTTPVSWCWRWRGEWLVCTSQPKTLLAGPALGLSNTVSVPVRVPLNTDGAATPACSVERMGRCAQGPRLAWGGKAPFVVGQALELRSPGLLESTHGTSQATPLLLTHSPPHPQDSPHSRMTWYVLDLISWFLLRLPRAPFRSSSFTGGRFFLTGVC